MSQVGLVWFNSAQAVTGYATDPAQSWEAGRTPPASVAPAHHHKLPLMPRTEGRPRGRAWQRLWHQVRARRDPCILCGQPIDYTLRYPDPMSFSVQHLQPVATHPHLAMNPAWLKSAHLRCNQEAGTKGVIPIRNVGPTSEDW